MWALVPIKELVKSKSRLEAVLDRPECTALALSMLIDVVYALEEAREITGIALLTTDPAVIDQGRKRGCRIITERPDLGFNENIDAAAAELEETGVDTLLTLPCDLPTISPNDVDRLCASHSDAVTVCPAICDGGTNALICTPPSAIKFQFGSDSAEKFLVSAQEVGISAARKPDVAFERDIDRPDDLMWLLDQPISSHAADYLRRSGIAKRLQSGVTGAVA